MTQPSNSDTYEAFIVLFKTFKNRVNDIAKSNAANMISILTWRQAAADVFEEGLRLYGDDYEFRCTGFLNSESKEKSD